MPKATYKTFAGRRCRVIYGRVPEGYAVTVVGLLPPHPFRKQRRDWSFNATSKADADQTIAMMQRRAASGRI
jgi:hypothetical protein